MMDQRKIVMAANTWEQSSSGLWLSSLSSLWPRLWWIVEKLWWLQIPDNCHHDEDHFYWIMSKMTILMVYKIYWYDDKLSYHIDIVSYHISKWDGIYICITMYHILLYHINKWYQISVCASRYTSPPGRASCPKMQPPLEKNSVFEVLKWGNDSDGIDDVEVDLENDLWGSAVWIEIHVAKLLKGSCPWLEMERSRCWTVWYWWLGWVEIIPAHRWLRAPRLRWCVWCPQIVQSLGWKNKLIIMATFRRSDTPRPNR